MPRTSTPALRRLALPAVLGLLAAPALALDSAPLLGRVAPSVYAIRTLGAHGAPLGSASAVVIGPGRLATTCSALAGAHAIVVRRGNVSYGATLQSPDVARDVCLLEVAELNAPAVTIAPEAAPAFGQAVLAVAAGEAGGIAARAGTVATLIADESGKLARIQVAAEGAATGSGGGLFDERGRLVGLLAAAGAGDKAVSALPAAWIATAPSRAATALAEYRSAAPRPAPVASTAPTVQPVAADGDTPRIGENWRYLLLDNMTGNKREVVYRIDSLDGERVILNQGGRVERRDGRLLAISTPAGGEFDVAAPPGGWVPADVKPGKVWKVEYQQAGTGYRMELNAIASGESTIRVQSKTYRAMRIAYEGYFYRPFYGFGSNSTIGVNYTAVAWYAPEARRVVRFDASWSAKTERVDESLQLVEHRLD